MNRIIRCRNPRVIVATALARDLRPTGIQIKWFEGAEVEIKIQLRRVEMTAKGGAGRLKASRPQGHHVLFALGADRPGFFTSRPGRRAH